MKKNFFKKWISPTWKRVTNRS